MAAPSIQLDLENALKSYLTGISLFVPAIPIVASHATESASDGTFVSIKADTPDWYALGGYNAQINVVFEFATKVSDPDVRDAQDIAHSVRTGSLIELLSMQNFAQAKGQLNPPAFPIPDTRPWKGLGFSAWEEIAPPAEERSETQIVTRLAYEFVVQLES
jgi:hypothetical protein